LGRTNLEGQYPPRSLTAYPELKIPEGAFGDTC